MAGVTVKQVSQKEELQEIFRQSQTAKIPVSVYRKPVPGGIALDFCKWQNIEVFDIDNLMVIVPPGTLLKDLNALAATKGLRFLPADTPLFESLSVGEWGYRGCPNPSAWKYGAGKHLLLGATYVFPNGEMAPVGGKCIKNVTGYDFTRFFTGAYADLAVGIQYIIKLMPQPESRYRYDVIFALLDDVVKFMDQLQRRSVPPAWLYWFDEGTGSRLFGKPQSGQRIIFELDGNEAEVLSHKAEIDKLLNGVNCQKTVEAGDLPDLSYIENSDDCFWLQDELKIAYQSIPALVDHLAGEIKKHKIGGGLFGQLADGKVHIYLEQPFSTTVSEIVAALQAETKTAGGAASGKFARLYGSHVATPLSILEASIKKRIDPELIFNRREG